MSFAHRLLLAKAGVETGARLGSLVRATPEPWVTAADGFIPVQPAGRADLRAVGGRHPIARLIPGAELVG